MHPKRNRLMKFTLFFTSFLFLFFFSACQEQEKSTKEATLFENYFIRYLELEQQTKAQASFLEGDSLSNAKPKSFTGGVSFQQSGMTKRQISDQLIRFEQSRKIAFAETFTFKYSSASDVSTRHTVRMTPIEDFFIKNNISKTKGLDIVVKGKNLSKNESLVFLFSDIENMVSSVEIKGPTHSIEFHLPAEKFVKLGLGTGKLYLVKKQTIKTSIDNRNIQSAIEYYTKDIEILIEE